MVRSVFGFLLLLVFGACSDDVQKLQTLVDKAIDEAGNYSMPVDNGEFFPASGNRVHGFYDYIIVGAGSAGSVLAYELSKNPKLRILLLEAGGDITEFSEIPAMAVYLYNSRMNWGYYTVPQKNSCQGMVNKQCLYQRGKVMGGSGSVNALFYTRGNKKDYVDWPGWSWKEIERSFKEIEKWQTDGDLGVHGLDGRLNCNKTNPDGPLQKPYTEALESLGLKEVDYNGKNQIGYSKAVYLIDFNKRVSGATAYLRNNTKNLEKLKNSFVTRVIIDGFFKRAWGVEFVRNKVKYTAYATKEVILSAGAINTPQILMLSGVGPKKELQRHRIKLIKDLPVGENFIGHPLYFGLNLRTNVSRDLGTMPENLKNYLNAGLPLTEGMPGAIVSYVRLDNKTNEKPDMEYLMAGSGGYGIAAKYMFNTDEIINQYMEDSKKNTDIGFFVLLLHPKSRGTIRLKSGDQKDFPLVDPNLFSDPNNEDLEKFYQGLEYLLRVIESEPMKSINATILPITTICKEHELMSKDYWLCVVKHISMESFHVSGTTKMGVSEKDSVVDKDGRVHGIRRLRVVDAGIIPETLSGHTNGPTFMLANKIARDIRRSLY